jgi:hypothetical protein
LLVVAVAVSLMLEYLMVVVVVLADIVHQFLVQHLVLTHQPKHRWLLVAESFIRLL